MTDEYIEPHDEFFDQFVETSENGSHTVIGKDRHGWLTIRQEGSSVSLTPETVDGELAELLDDEF